jgi:phosphatidylglycerophosphate synthase
MKQLVVLADHGGTVSTVRTGPILGLIAQFVLLFILTATVGLGPAGWLTGVASGLVTCVALTRGLRHSPSGTLGPADWVTLGRAVLVGGAAALTVESVQRPVPTALVVSITVVALILDAIDGLVARRTRTMSALGARFDGEIDAFLILVLSGYVAPTVGVWVLAIGVMRYAFMAGGWVLPWLRGKLPFRYWRKVVTAVQGIALVVAAAGVLPAVVIVPACAGALALLAESFGRDVFWLWRHRTPAPVPARAQAGARPRVRTRLQVRPRLQARARAARAHSTVGSVD